jgi:hypothetical protein
MMIGRQWRAVQDSRTVVQMSKRKIEDLLRESHSGFSPLQKLLRQAANQDIWTATLRALLPDSMARDCRVTELRGTTLTIACRNNGSATRLRFMVPELLPALRELGDFRGVQDIRVRVSLI